MTIFAVFRDVFDHVHRFSLNQHFCLRNFVHDEHYAALFTYAEIKPFNDTHSHPQLLKD